MTTRANELILLKRCLNGDSTAFELIVSKYQQLICAITYSATADIQRSEELAHQTFINAWNKLAQLKDLSKFRPWLCNIARNNIRDFIKKNKRDIIAKAKPMENINDTPAEQSTPLDSAIKKERKALVSHAIQQIPEQYREPLVLYYRNQQSVKQVAQSLDLSEDVVKQRLQRGRKMIKDQLSSIVEETLSTIGPKKAFTTAVIASVASIAIKTTGTAAAATIAATTSTSATAATTTTSIMSTIAAKVITTAAVVAISIGGIITYKQVTKPESPQAEMIVQQQEQGTEGNIQEKSTEPATHETANLSTIDKAKDNLKQAQPIVSSPIPVLARKDNFKFKPKGVLSGQITDIETGQPVTDARVKINIGPIFEAVTDPNGFYYFKSIDTDGNYEIRVITKEYVGLTDYRSLPTVYLSKDKQTVKHFQLPKACMIDIQVVDEKGEPIKKAELYTASLRSELPRNLNGPYETQYTDEDGYFLIGGLPASKDDYLIFAIHNVETHRTDRKRYVNRYYDYAPGHITVNLNDPEIIESGQIVLKDGVDVNGYVEYSDGIPASDIGISAEPQWWHSSLSINDVKVDKNGYFTLKHITPGNYSIASHIDNPGIASRSSHKITQARFPLQSKDELLIVTLPNKSPQQHVTISGRFVSTNTRRLKNVSIIASSPQLSPRLGHWFKKSDDPNNSFVIDRLEPGNYNLSFSGSDIKAVVLENVKAPSEGLVVELEYVKKSTIRGIVINPQTTDPVKDFKLRIKQVRSFGGHGQPSRWNEFSTDDGQFQIASVSPGIYQLQILADGFALTKSDDIDVTEHNFISIELKKGGSIKGIVTDAKDAPVKGAKILPYSLAGNIKRDNKIIFDSEQGAVATNTDGSFIIENLTPGNEILKVTHPDYCSVIKEDIEVIAGQITEVKFVLNTGGAIEGYLYDENGKPQPNVALLVYEGFIVSAFDKAFTATVTDANGYYYIDVLPEEICQIKRNNEWSALGVTKIPIVPLLGKTLRIDIGKGTNIIGQLIVDSQPLPNTRIMVSGNYGYHSGIFRYNGLTDSQGNFKLRGIIQGSFSLYYPNPVKQNHWVKFASFEVDSRDIDLGIVPKNFATVFVNITQTSKEHPFSIVKVPVQEGVETYGADIGVVEIPETETQPYIIKNLLPGTHTLIIERSDYTKFRREFEITEDSQQLEIDFEIPECNAGFSAKVFNSKSTHLNFWSENYNLQGTIIADQNDEFKADNLPADTYYFGSKRNDGDHYITAQLILGNGEQKTIDIDMDIAEQPPKHDGYRAIVVVNENGLPLNTRDLWIDNGTERFDIRYHTDYLLCFIGKQGKYTLHANIPGYKDPAIDFQLNPAPTGTPMNKIKPFILRLQKKDLSPKTIRQ